MKPRRRPPHHVSDLEHRLADFGTCLAVIMLSTAAAALGLLWLFGS